MTNFDTTLKIYDINLKFRKFRTLIKLLLLFEIRGSWRALTVGIAILLGCNKSENARVSEFPYQIFTFSLFFCRDSMHATTILGSSSGGALK